MREIAAYSVAPAPDAVLILLVEVGERGKPAAALTKPLRTSFTTRQVSRSSGSPQPPGPGCSWRNTSPRLMVIVTFAVTSRFSVSGLMTLTEGLPGRPP